MAGGSSLASMKNDVTKLDPQKEMRWDGRSRCHYEAWYTTLNQVSAGAGFWIRYALLVPCKGTGHVQLWFASHVPAISGARVSVVQRYPMDQFSASRAPFCLHIGPNSMESGRMTGMIEAGGAPVTWDLVYEPVTDPLQDLPEVFYRTRWIRSKFLTPHPFLMIGGKIQLGDHTFILNGDPGQQGHIWGRRHAEEWSWFHCSSLVQEGGEPIAAYVTGVTAQQRLPGGMVLPPLSFGHLVWQEKHLQIRPVTSWNERWKDRWEWKGNTEDEDVRITLTVPWAEMVLAQYEDPAGHSIFCHHTERADCIVQFRAPRQPPRVYRSTGRAHLEIGSRCPDPRVSRKVTLQG